MIPFSDSREALESFSFIIGCFDIEPLKDGDGRPVYVIPLDDSWVYVFSDGMSHHSYYRPDLYQEALNAHS